MIPGEIFTQDRDIIINKGRNTKMIRVSNNGDRPVQVGSHFHFFEVNKCLKFNRSEAFGFHLDIPSGTSVRFEPGEEKEVQLVEMGGRKVVYGCNDLTCGKAVPENLEAALKKAEAGGII